MEALSWRFIVLIFISATPAHSKPAETTTSPSFIAPADNKTDRGIDTDLTQLTTDGSETSVTSSLNNILRLTQANKNANNPNAVAVWPWLAAASFVVKICVIAKWIAIFAWGWIMEGIGIGTKEFHDKYFQLTTTTTEKTTTAKSGGYGPSPAASSYGYGHGSSRSYSNAGQQLDILFKVAKALDMEHMVMQQLTHLDIW